MGAGRAAGRIAALAGGAFLAAACSEEKIPAAPVADAGPPRPVACASQDQCEPWEECKDGVCAPLGCFRDADCKSGQSCLGGRCARPRAAFCVQTGRPPPDDCAPELALDFGAVLLHQTVEISLRILNTGNAPLQVGGIELLNDLVNPPPRTDFTLSVSGSAAEGGAPWTLTPDLDLVATVRYRPSDAFEDSAVLVISTDDAGALQTRVPVRTFIKGRVEISALPGVLDFGFVPTGDAETRELVLANVGTFTSVLEIEEIRSGHPAFRITPKEPLPHFLAVGGQLTADVVYAPTVDENNDSALTVRSNDPELRELSVPLAGFSSATLLFITSQPTLRATEGRPWTYAAKLTDGTSRGPWTWTLEGAPAGMSVEGTDATGVLRWTPAEEQVGTHPLTLVVTNPRRGVARQSFAVTVFGQYRLSGLDPRVGSACGGRPVQLLGKYLRPGSRVWFGGVEALLAESTDGALTAVAPQLPEGRWYEVTVSEKDDPTNEAVLDQGFLATPEIIGASAGEVEVGQTVKLTGCGLISHSVLLPTAPYGGTYYTTVIAAGPTELTFRVQREGAPPWASGAVVVQGGAGHVESNPWPLAITGASAPRLMIGGAKLISGDNVEITGCCFRPEDLGYNWAQFYVPVPWYGTDRFRYYSSQEGWVRATQVTPTRMVVQVPEGAVTAPLLVSVQTNNPGEDYADINEFAPRAFEIPGSEAPRYISGASHTSLPQDQRRLVLYGSGFGDQATELTVRVRGSDQVYRLAAPLWTNGTELLIELPELPLGAAEIEVKNQNYVRNKVYFMPRPVEQSVDYRLVPLLITPVEPERVAHGGALPEPTADGLSGEQTTLYRLGATAADLLGAIVFVDQNRVRIYNRQGIQPSFYGKTVPTGTVATIYTHPLVIDSVALDGFDLLVGGLYQLLRISWETGKVTKIVDGPLGSNSGPISDATVVRPRAIATRGDGVVYVDDSSNTPLGVRMANFNGYPITRHGVTVPPGHIRTVAPALAGTYGAIAVDPSGNLYLANRHVSMLPEGSSTPVRLISSAGAVSLPVGEDVPLAEATLGGYAQALAYNPFGGGLYVGTSAGVVRRIRDGRVVTIAGDPLHLGFAGDGGPAAQASLRRVVTPVIDGEGNLLVLGGCRIRRVLLGAEPPTISTLVGTGCWRPTDGKAASIAYPAETMAVDAASDRPHRLYTSEPATGAIWESDPASGSARVVAEIDEVVGLAVQGGKLYAYQGATPRIYEVTLGATPTQRVIAGTGEPGTSGDGDAATSARLGGIDGGRGWRWLSEAAGGLLAVSDGTQVRLVNPTSQRVNGYGYHLDPGQIERFAGGGDEFDEYSYAWEQRLGGVGGLSLHPTGDLLIADFLAGRVYRLGSGSEASWVYPGYMPTVVGPQRRDPSSYGYVEMEPGYPAFGRLSHQAQVMVRGVTVDAGGNLLLPVVVGASWQTAIVQASDDREVYSGFDQYWAHPVLTNFAGGASQIVVAGSSFLVLNSAGAVVRHQGAPVAPE